MDYEKAYKEALSRARQFSEHPLQEDSDSIVEYIFPELKESDDERIRKEIIDYHRSMAAQADDYVHEAWIAWLEKQGMKKHAWSEDDEAHIDSLLKRLDGLCRNEFERTRFAISEDKDWLKSLKERIGG